MLKVSTIFSKSKILLLYKKQNTPKTNKNNIFNKKTNLTFVCPITNTVSDFPLHVKLDERIITTGVILCEHLKAFEINKRTYKIVESLPMDILEQVIDIIFAEIEIEDEN